MVVFMYDGNQKHGARYSALLGIAGLTIREVLACGEPIVVAFGEVDECECRLVVNGEGRLGIESSDGISDWIGSGLSPMPRPVEHRTANQTVAIGLSVSAIWEKSSAVKIEICET